MNKSETREILKLRAWHAAKLIDDGAAARSISALIRASMTKKSRVALLDAAHQLGVSGHPEFVI